MSYGYVVGNNSINYFIYTVEKARESHIFVFNCWCPAPRINESYSFYTISTYKSCSLLKNVVTLGGFPNEVQTIIRHLIIYCYHNFN